MNRSSGAYQSRSQVHITICLIKRKRPPLLTFIKRSNIAWPPGDIMEMSTKGVKSIKSKTYTVWLLLILYINFNAWQFANVSPPVFRGVT